ncbi:hypothetical protein P7C71_g882, partial [Lecanoromycetidae sp. Uapishka_2]
MPSRTPQAAEAIPEARQSVVTHMPSKTVVKETQREANGAGTPRQSTKEADKNTRAQDVSELKDYQLGDCLGKGAFGSVFRALNMGTGETVAVKQVKLADLPKSELRVITLEIDLLKNLDHPNIVKYRGFVKSAESLNIILEYCENGSLHSISKNFGKFPENLVGIYMSQVLHGLLYLHEQGVIHRDIKGANILTTKQGLVKLADFGVATRTTTFNESSVVGTPYWMAPEVIELSGATTASDIWSLGCTVIELLDGKPPYHKMQPMHALFRIVNDDHPPLPEGASPIVRDFLMQCFQKDPNLRVSARKLLKHPWIVNSKRSDAVVPNDEAVKSVQQWNEALKSPESGSLRRASRPMSSSPIPGRREPNHTVTTPVRGPLNLAKPRVNAEQFRSPSNTSDDNWDDDFASEISPNALQLPQLRPHDNFGGLLSSEKLKAFASFETVTEEANWDDNFEGDLTVKSPSQLHGPDPLETIRPFNHKRNDTQQVKTTAASKSPDSKKSPVVGRRAVIVSAVHQEQPPPKPKAPLSSAKAYMETSEDDFSDLVTDETIFDLRLGKVKQNGPLAPKLFHPSNMTSLIRAMQPSKPGGSLRRPLTNSRQPLMRRTRSSVEIQRYAEDDLDEDYSDVFGKGGTVLNKPESDKGSDEGTLMLSSKLSNNSWLGDDEDDDDDPFAQLEEGFDEMDLEANVARDKYARLCTQVEGLVGSLKVSQADDMLADLSEQLLEVLSDLPDTKDVIISAHGMLPMLEILENCRHRDVIFNLLKIVNTIIFNDVEIQENLCFVGGIPIITKFASRKYSSEIRLEAAAFVRQMFQTSTLTLQMFVSAGGLKVLVEFLEEDYEDERDLVLIGVNGIWSVFELQGPTPKNDFCRILSRNSVLDPLSLVLSRVLDEQGELAELCEGRIANIFFLFSQAENHVKELEDAALNGIIPVLQRIIKTKGPLKEFALPVLCDMAHSGKVGRRELWRNKGLAFYISLLADEYWQVTALDAIFIWLQEETAKVEEHLLDGSFPTAIIKCFTTSKANAFESLLEPLQKLLRLSPPVALSLAHPDLFHRILRKLQSNKAVVRLNLLRIVRSICDASEEQGALISRYGLEDTIHKLAENDGAVLVRNMAGELIKSSEMNDRLEACNQRCGTTPTLEQRWERGERVADYHEWNRIRCQKPTTPYHVDSAD